jgi:glycosyltransferase involved in cell wall biosynthesis
LICHVIDSLGNVGGAEQQLVEQLHRFSSPKLAHAVVCLYEAGPAQSRRNLLPESAPYYSLSRPGEPKPNRWTAHLRLNAILDQVQPQLLHCSLPDASLAARIVAWRRSLPLIETLVNISHESVRTASNPNATALKLAFHRTLDRLTMRSVTRFQAISRAVAESWSHTIGIDPARIEVIPRGVDLAAFSSVDRGAARRLLSQELSLPEDTVVLLNLGREQPQKGQRFLLEAMPAILREVPKAVLLLAGSPGIESQVLRQSASGLGLAVRFLGRRNDVPQLLAASDIFVFPSLYEGLGVSLLEAMAAGLAIITSDRPPMNEVIELGENGLLVPAADSKRLAEEVVRLACDDELRKRLGRAAQTEATARFSIDKSSELVERLYCQVLGIETC